MKGRGRKPVPKILKYKRCVQTGRRPDDPSQQHLFQHRTSFYVGVCGRVQPLRPSSPSCQSLYSPHAIQRWASKTGSQNTVHSRLAESAYSKERGSPESCGGRSRNGKKMPKGKTSAPK